MAILLFACKEQLDKPVWVNEQSQVYAPSDSLHFNCKGKEWKAVLAGFIQPIELKTLPTINGITIVFARNSGIIEGPAQLILSKGDQSFVYDFNLLNTSDSNITEKDYRSPKTVNPDSSLNQQRIVFEYDQWHNLVQNKNTSEFFSEQMIDLSTKAGTYHAQKNKPLSAFYVQAGSAVAISVNATYLSKDRSFKVIAGPLRDRYNNIVANGTLVLFKYEDGTKTTIREIVSLNGYAIDKIKADVEMEYLFTANIHNTYSKPIILQLK